MGGGRDWGFLRIKKSYIFFMFFGSEHLELKELDGTTCPNFLPCTDPLFTPKNWHYVASDKKISVDIENLRNSFAESLKNPVLEPRIRQNPDLWKKLMRGVPFTESALNIVKFGSKYLFVPSAPPSQ